MKIRLQISIGLLMIAAIFSVIAVSLGWYAANPGKVNFKSESVTVKSSDKTYEISYYLKKVGMAKKTLTGYEIVSGLPSSYQGQTGIDNDTYIVIYEFVDKEGTNILPAKGSSLLTGSSIVTKADNSQVEDTTTANENFKITVLDSNYQKLDTYTEISYFAIEFASKDGTTPFIYSDVSYKGSSFSLTLQIS